MRHLHSLVLVIVSLTLAATAHGQEQEEPDLMEEAERLRLEQWLFYHNEEPCKAVSVERFQPDAEHPFVVPGPPQSHYALTANAVVGAGWTSEAGGHPYLLSGIALQLSIAQNLGVANLSAWLRVGLQGLGDPDDALQGELPWVQGIVFLGRRHERLHYREVPFSGIPESQRHLPLEERRRYECLGLDVVQSTEGWGIGVIMPGHRRELEQFGILIGTADLNASRQTNRDFPAHLHGLIGAAVYPSLTHWGFSLLMRITGGSELKEGPFAVALGGEVGAFFGGDGPTEFFLQLSLGLGSAVTNLWE